MKKMTLSPEDLTDLMTGHTINVPLSGSREEVILEADVPGTFRGIAVGNPFDGMTVYGPFTWADDAMKWAEGNEYQLIDIHPPVDADDSGADTASASHDDTAGQEPQPSGPPEDSRMAVEVNFPDGSSLRWGNVPADAYAKLNGILGAPETSKV